MQLVDKDKLTMIKHYTSSLKSQKQTGGSAANTANGIANLSLGSAYIGMVGDDEFGDFYTRDMIDNSIEPRFFKSETTQTGQALALISKDGERTFATYLGAAIEMNESLLSEGVFKNHDYFHIEGYLVSNQALVRKAIGIAKSLGLKISIDLASYNIVEENLDFLKEICKDVDIIFANEDEARAFTGREAEEALDIISEFSGISIVKIGKKGSLIKANGKKYSINEVKRNLLDTTGAGDMYAAGFLAGLCQDRPIDVCGKMGSILAGNVIEIYGAKMDNIRWGKIKKEISEIN